MSSVHTTAEEFTNAPITSHFAFVFEENTSGRQIIKVIMMSSFSKRSVFKIFTLKRKAGVFKFLRFEGRFRDGLVWTVGLTVEIKLRFRDGLVWTVDLTVEIKLLFVTD